MKPKDLFSLAVRILGLVFLSFGLWALPAALAIIFSSSSPGIMLTGSVAVAWPLLVASWLLHGAPLLVNIAYPDSNGHPERGQDVAGVVTKKTDA